MKPTVSAPVMRQDLSLAQGRAHNIDYQFVSTHYLLNRQPDFVVYLYNVSEQSFKMSRPPIIREMVAPGRKRDQRYTFVTSFPCPLLHPKPNVDSSEFDIVASDTRRFVMDLINPDNTGLNQDAVISAKDAFGQGQDLGRRGLFWSLNGPGASKNERFPGLEQPTDDEVNAAIRRMERHYRFLLDEARAVETSNPGLLHSMLTPEHNFAADYFNEITGWHKPTVRANTGTCPNCGDSIKAGAAFHKTDEGVLCIIDWARAIRAGVRTKQQAIDAGIEGFAENKPLSPPTVQASDIIAVPEEKTEE